MEGHELQAVQDGHKLDPPVNDALPLKALQPQHAAQIEVRRIERPPGPPDEGHFAPLEVGISDIWRVPRGIRSRHHRKPERLCPLYVRSILNF